MEKTIDKFADEQEMLDAYINGEYSAKEIVSVFLPDDVKEQYNIYEPPWKSAIKTEGYLKMLTV